MEKELILPRSYNYISAFLTMRCNLKCNFCLNVFSQDFNRKRFKEIPGEQWVTSLNRLKSREEVPITFSGGEPFLHKDFIYILNNLKKDLSIDILTNLQWGEKGIEKFLSEVSPERIKRRSPYPSIRASYHPDQMDASSLVKNVSKLQNAGFSIGIWAVMYPSPNQLSAINEMQFRCKDSGIEFRLKEYTGKYRGEIYGDYSKYPESAFSQTLKECSCKTSELLISTNGEVYRCHRDLFSEQYPLGKISHPEFDLQDIYRRCQKYGQCHPCDVKLKTNYKQELKHTSVDINEIK